MTATWILSMLPAVAGDELYNNMNARLFFLITTIVVANIGRAADPTVDSVVAGARSDPANAPAIVALAVIEHPKSLERIVTDSVAALPDRAVDIVRALLKVAPKQAAAIVGAAIQGAPKLAVEITTAAVALLPDRRAEIIAAAVDAAPVELRGVFTAPMGESLRASGITSDTTPPSFPAQPIRPDLVSPSS
jgi:hypothetical protein